MYAATLLFEVPLTGWNMGMVLIIYTTINEERWQWPEYLDRPIMEKEDYIKCVDSWKKRLEEEYGF